MDALVFHGWSMRMLGSLRATVLLAVFSCDYAAFDAGSICADQARAAAKLRRCRTFITSSSAALLVFAFMSRAALDTDKPVLLVSNHISWLDIPGFEHRRTGLLRVEIRNGDLAFCRPACEVAAQRFRGPDAAQPFEEYGRRNRRAARERGQHRALRRRHEQRRQPGSAVPQFTFFRRFFCARGRQ